MAMTLRQDVVAAQMQQGECRPVDLVHLSNQTMGDQSLESEVLGIFLSQSQIYMNLLRTSNDHEVLHKTAHALKGAARGIGAFELANKAGKIEDDPFSCKGCLEKELNIALNYIKGIIH